MPPGISYWPPAPGWLIFAFILFLAILLVIIWIWRRFKKKRPKNEALKILKNIKKQYYKNNDQLKTLKALSHLIRRISLTYYKKEVVTSIHGNEWLKFLDETGNTNDFTKGEGKILGVEIYKLNPEFKIDSLFPIVKRWIEKTQYNY